MNLAQQNTRVKGRLDPFSIKNVFKFVKVTNYLVLLIFVISYKTYPQTSTTKMTPIGDFDIKPQMLQVHEKFHGQIDTNLTIYLPEGFRAKVFHIGGMSKPRFFAWSPDSVLHVTNISSGIIVALPDLDQDGVADTTLTVATGFNRPHDLEFYNGTLLVAEEHQITKLTDTNGDGKYNYRQVLNENIPTGGHYTRTIVVDSLNNKMYLSIGSSCNVCREENRAIIEQFNIDGTGRRTFAMGIRNAVGMTLHPRTGKLWATNNGSDRQGNDIPPEWIDIVRDGGFYGHPFAHSNQVYFDFSAHPDYSELLPITSDDSNLVQMMIQPAALIQAHSAPMAIEFTNTFFPPQFRGGAFIAYRGSWNRYPATGYKVVYLDFNDDQDTTANFVADFMTGFLTDSTHIPPERWARPVGLAIDLRGNLYVGSDAINEFIMIIYQLPRFSIVPIRLDFGEVPVIKPDTLSVIIKNSGMKTVKITDIDNSRVEFIVSEMSTVLAVGDSMTLSVAFAPTSNGELNDTLEIYSNVSNKTTLAPLSGTGNAAPIKPKALTATASLDEIVIFWSSNNEEDIKLYEIFRSLDSGFTPDTMSNSTYTTSDTFYVDTDLSKATKYHYRVLAIDKYDQVSEFSEEASVSSLSIESASIIPTEFVLHQNYPNPFNPITTIRYDLPEQKQVTLIIYDLIGREIRKLVNTTQDAGYQSIIWDGTGEFGESVGTGIFLYQIKIGDFSQTKKMLLLR